MESRIYWEEKPKQLEFKLNGPIEVSLHHTIHDNSSEWYMTCYKLDIIRRKLFTSDEDEAKRKVIEVLKSKMMDISNILEDLKSVVESMQ